MKISNNEELAEFIANHLPISSEDARNFVDGALNGGMFTDRINFTMALSFRDKQIEAFRQENQELRKKLYGV